MRQVSQIIIISKIVVFTSLIYVLRRGVNYRAYISTTTNVYEEDFIAYSTWLINSERKLLNTHNANTWLFGFERDYVRILTGRLSYISQFLNS